MLSLLVVASYVTSIAAISAEDLVMHLGYKPAVFSVESSDNAVELASFQPVQVFL